MAVNVYIPTPYRQVTGGKSQLAVEARTVRELIERVVELYPGLRERLLTPEGGIAGHLGIFVNEQEIRTLQGPETPLKEGDEVAFVPAMAGGAGGPGRSRLTREQLERYNRQIRLDELGVEGQKRLLDSRVLLIGAGALGSPNAIYLAAAGVGTIGIVDGDRVDLSNMHRQVLHFTHDIGRKKTQSARRHLEDLNPDVRVVEHDTFLTSENALDIIGQYDLVINGSDNFPTRYLVNDACVMLKKPLVDASILRFEGQATVFLPGQGCYRCLFPSPPPPGTVPSCAEAGIIGALAGHLGTLQALEAIKILLGIGEPLVGRLLLFDALSGRHRVVRWRRNPACPVCGDHPTITRLIDYEAFCGVPQDGRHDGRALHPEPATVSARPLPGEKPEETVARLGWAVEPEQVAAELGLDGIQWIDVREPHEYRAFRIPGAKLIPLGSLPERLGEIDPGRKAYLICLSGQRSGRATLLLRQAGYEQVYNLNGGMLAWVNSQLPTERG